MLHNPCYFDVCCSLAKHYTNDAVRFLFKFLSINKTLKESLQLRTTELSTSQNTLEKMFYRKMIHNYNRDQFTNNISENGNMQRRVCLYFCITNHTFLVDFAKKNFWKHVEKTTTFFDNCKNMVEFSKCKLFLVFFFVDLCMKCWDNNNIFVFGLFFSVFCIWFCSKNNCTFTNWKK